MLDGNVLKIKQSIYDNPGYSLDYKLSSEDLGSIRSIVEEQFLGNIKTHYPNLLENFKEAGIANYHQNSHLVEHEKIWPKLKRCLSKDSCNKIKAMDFWKDIERDFAPFSLGPVVYEKEVDFDRDEMYWRIVRPNEAGDIGTLHADRWFHESMKIRERVFPDHGNALKVWLALYTETGLNGLAIVPGSHKEKWDYKSVEIENTAKPRIKGDESAVETVLLATSPGDIVIFNEDIVHVGAINKGSETRISLEITLIREHC